jgi:hypothetical protein
MTEFFFEYGYYTLLGGLAVAILAYLLLIVAAFRTSLGWGFAVLLFPPIAPVFIVIHASRAVTPLCLFLLSGALIGATFLVHHYRNVDLGPRQRIVEGERHVTLTGWDQKDYSILASMPDLVVLQMANPDVTDETLMVLKGFSQLREIDLNDTGVTDEGLKTLAELPNLEIVRLRGTQVTDQGFRDTLGKKSTLVEIDARKSAVTSKTLREWKEENKEKRRYLK